MDARKELDKLISSEPVIRVLSLPDGSPVFVSEFIDWDGLPYVRTNDFRLFRMKPSNSDKLPYTLVPASSAVQASILTYGSIIDEKEAVSLL